MIVLEGIIALLFFVLSILAHEGGHLLAFLYYGVAAELRFKRTDTGYVFKVGVPEDYNLESHKLKMVYFVGIIAGLGVLQIYTLIPLSALFIHWLVVFYLVGCHKDFKNMFQLMRYDYV